MSCLKKFVRWLKNPRGHAVWITYLLTALFVAAALAAVIIMPEGVWAAAAYAAYCLAGVFFMLSVVITVRLAPTLKQRTVSLLKRNKVAARMMEQYDFRTICFALLSFTVTIAYAVYNGVIGITRLSVWYGALAVYYILLALMRGGVLSGYRPKAEKRLKEKEIAVYGRCGAALIFMPLCLSVVIARMVSGYNSFEHPGMMIYAAALYAFCKIIAAVVHMFKARKTDDFGVRAIRSVNLADAMVSILALQTAMFAEFSPGGDNALFNAATGFGVCVLTAALGVFMIIVARKEKRKPTEEENNV